MRIAETETASPEAIRLAIWGQLDLLSASALREALAKAIRVNEFVELDLDQVDFIDGHGLSTLMDAESDAPRRLRIVGASTCVRRLIDVTDTADRVPPFAITG